jgi:hypothetical protein
MGVLDLLATADPPGGNRWRVENRDRGFYREGHPLFDISLLFEYRLAMWEDQHGTREW